MVHYVQKYISSQETNKQQIIHLILAPERQLIGRRDINNDVVHQNNGNHCDSRNLGYWANWKYCVHLRPSQNKRNTGIDLTFWRLMLKADVLKCASLIFLNLYTFFRILQLRDAFARILISLAVFDITFLIATGMLFALGWVRI